MQRRCDRNRKRSKRRAIYCPIHGCYLDSVSQKYPVFADQPEQLQERGVGRRQAALAIADKTTIPLSGDWIEAFWCEHCQKTEWYRVRRGTGQLSSHQSATYEVSLVPSDLWQRVTGVINSKGNPSVSEFTQRQSRMVNYNGVKDFNFVR